MENLDQVQLQAAQQIINAGLLNAANSLSFFIKEKLSFDQVILKNEVFEFSPQLSAKGSENIHLLITEVIGDLKGICYLVFSEDEANQLKNAALPPDIQNDPQRAGAMGDAIMLEVDNIIAASVITQFSNSMKLKIYGGIPCLKKLSFDELNSFLKDSPRTRTYAINFKVSFCADKLNFRPDFIWLFHEDFFEYVKKFAGENFKLQSSGQSKP